MSLMSEEESHMYMYLFILKNIILQHLILISWENVITARANLPSLHPSPPSEASSCVLHLIDEGPDDR